MRASKLCVWGWCAVGMFDVVASGADIVLVPVSASGLHTIVGDEIILEGGGQRVFLEIELSGWSPELLNAWQTVIDSSGYTSGIQGALAPAVESCTTTAECVTAFGSGSSCTVPAGPGLQCTAGFIDSSRSDYVFSGLTNIPTVDISTLDYRFGGTLVLSPPVADPGVPRYAASLVLFVPSGAMGTFTIGFFGPPASALFNPNTLPIEPLTLTSARITVKCLQDPDCNDGNACTEDACGLGGTCTNANNYDKAISCCNPANGVVTPIDDGNACTNDICNTADGSVMHDPTPGAPCGDPTDNACTNPDTCDGAGNCQANDELAGTLCGDPSDTDCTDPDTCDGAGNCQANDELAGTLCGDPSNTDCTDPDTCDGTGGCQDNHAPDSTPCNDNLFCTTGETCTAGVCGGGGATDCDDGISCTLDSCNEVMGVCENELSVGFCLISAICHIDGEFNPANDCEECNTVLSTTSWSFRPAGSVCDDGDPCTGTGREGIGVDTCNGAGVCAGVLDLECNDQCAFAVPVVEGVNTGNNTNGGPDDVEALCQPDSNNDVWFKYTAPCTGTVFLSTNGSQFTPSNDAVLSVYDACPHLGGVEIACDDDSGVGLQAALTFPTTAATVYWLRVAGYRENAGDIVLNIEPFDDCLIDGTCYPAGALNPASDCVACIPAVATTSWSPLPKGSACGNPSDTECDSPDACDGAGVCESNHKPDGTPCADDGNDCTFDLCSGGGCSRPPRPFDTPCGDPSDSQCDHPDTCDGAGTCQLHQEALGTPCGDPSETQCDRHDICDGAGLCDDNLTPDGTPCDDGDICTGDDACDTGECVGMAIPTAPLVVSEGSRHLAVTPQPPGSAAPVALFLTSPDWPCLTKYISADGDLVPDPVIRFPSEWDRIVVQSVDMIPSSTYEVVAKCGGFVSGLGSDTTAAFGDVVGVFVAGQWGPPNGIVDVLDMRAGVEAFQHLATAPEQERVDLWPCTPDGIIDILDILMIVNGFQGRSYVASTACPVPCP